MRKLLILCVIIFLSYNKDSFSQRPYITEIIKLAGSNARAYFLAANRSSYGVTSYVSPKDYLELSTGTYFNDAVYEIPIDFSYGLSDNVELSAGMIAYSVSYNYLAEKISGIGDAYAGLKYLFHQSEYFDHVVQGLVKIPTASKKKELGTGKFDFHFGLAQGFFYKKFSYDLDFDFSLLARKDYPAGIRYIPPELRAQFDSLKKVYDYKYEPEISVSFVPAYNFSDNFMLYSGYSFTRNTRLDYNISSVLGGMGISLSRSVNLSLGTSFGLGVNSGWIADLILNFLLLGNHY